MLANRILNVLIGVLAFLVVPLQLITTFVLGLLVSLSFGILLLPITLIWVVFSFPMIGASWLTVKIGWLRTPIGLIGIPWAILADIFVSLMPSMGEMESRAAKLMLAESWPYSWECWRFQIGKLDLSSPECAALREVIGRISRGNPLMERTVNRIASGEALDPKV
ncbi:MAG: hypothetical protein KKD92_00415 [Proteobacteria bacterium]|nr:hypothetical protein [Pseudomonadota bacterium]